MKKRFLKSSLQMNELWGFYLSQFITILNLSSVTLNIWIQIILSLWSDYDEPRNQRPERIIPGLKKCGSCSICPYLQPENRIQSSRNNKFVEINAPVNCKSRNVVYIITCNKCLLQYIGKPERTLCERIQEHLLLFWVQIRRH